MGNLINIEQPADKFCWNCDCGSQEFYILVADEVDHEVTGYLCVGCGRIVPFEDDDEIDN